MALIAGPLALGLNIQLIGSVIPLVVLTVMIWRKTQGTPLVVGLTVSAALIMTAVLAMRWNVVIGGQELSKTMKGLLTYHAPIWGREGILAAASVFVAPFFVLWALTRLFPPWAAGGQRA